MIFIYNFDKDNFEKYFLMFEKVAEGLLTGKTKDVYCALSTQQCANYEFVKEKILQAYELVPEAYRQRFRNLVKQGNQTYVEFVHDQENAYVWWLSSIKVTDFDGLRQLLLVDEFKAKVNADVKLYLDEQKVVDLKTTGSSNT